MDIKVYQGNKCVIMAKKLGGVKMVVFFDKDTTESRHTQRYL